VLIAGTLLHFSLRLLLHYFLGWEHICAATGKPQHLRYGHPG
jgi:hypothetical protein